MKSFRTLALALAFSLVLMGCAAQAPSTEEGTPANDAAVMDSVPADDSAVMPAEEAVETPASDAAETAE